MFRSWQGNFTSGCLGESVEKSPCGNFGWIQFISRWPSYALNSRHSGAPWSIRDEKGCHQNHVSSGKDAQAALRSEEPEDLRARGLLWKGHGEEMIEAWMGLGHRESRGQGGEEGGSQV